MGQVIIPKIYVKEIESPLIFLAGPIRGAPNWQDPAIKFLFSQNSKLAIVSPRRGVRETILPYLSVGDENHFERQREWERHYLDVAAASKNHKGVVMFWLPGEQNHDCQKAYGAMTRLELGQLMTLYKNDPSTRFCVGTDGKFSEMSTIAYDLSIDASDKIIRKTLKETCLEALSFVS